MRTRLLLLSLVLGGAALADAELLPPAWRRWHDAILPTEREMKWRQIPWMTDLAEARADAKVEKRPLMVWVAGDDPLDRC